MEEREEEGKERREKGNGAAAREKERGKGVRGRGYDRDDDRRRPHPRDANIWWGRKIAGPGDQPSQVAQQRGPREALSFLIPGPLSPETGAESWEKKPFRFVKYTNALWDKTRSF